MFPLIAGGKGRSGLARAISSRPAKMFSAAATAVVLLAAAGGVGAEEGAEQVFQCASTFS